MSRRCSALKLSKALDAGAALFVSAGMAAGAYTGLTQGWGSYIDYLAFLPKGTRIFAGFPYSLILFGTLALYCIYRYGWVGLFVAAFLEEVWEFLYDLTPAVFYGPSTTWTKELCSGTGQNATYHYFCFYPVTMFAVRPHYPLYILMAVGLGAVALLVVLKFKGDVFNKRRMLLFCLLFLIFCLYTNPWTIWAELIGQVLFLGLIAGTAFLQDPPGPKPLPEGTFNHRGNSQDALVAETVAGYLVAKFHPKIVLDVGAGKGLLVEELRDFGVESYGIDYNEPGARSVASKWTIVCDATKGIGISFAAVDLVTSIGVLQYVKDQEAMLAEMRLVLKPGGHLFLCAETGSRKPYLMNITERAGFRFVDNADELKPVALGRTFGLLSWWPLRRAAQKALQSRYVFWVFQAV
jgi:hypothetical protein